MTKPVVTTTRQPTKRELEADVKIVRKVAEAGDNGCFIDHWKQWLRAERLADRKYPLLKKKMVERSRNERETKFAPRFWVTDLGKAFLEKSERT